MVIEFSPPITAKQATMEVEVRAPVGLREDCATVAVFNADTEAPVVGQQQWDVVHGLRSRALSTSAIARGLGLDRKTVRGCLSVTDRRIGATA